MISNYVKTNTKPANIKGVYCLPIVFAGGFGTRLEPLSTEERPKQFVKMFERQMSLFQLTINRIRDCFDSEIVVIINKQHIQLVKEQLKEVAFERYVLILEDECNNNFVSSLLACKMAQNQGYNKVFIFPSDHFVNNNVEFCSCVKQAIDASCVGKNHMMFGVKPTEPVSRYGYIELNDKLDDDIFAVKTFVEKPPVEIADYLIKNGKYLWNSGMFLLDVETFLQEVKNMQSSSYNEYQNITFTSLGDKIFGFNYAVCEKIAKKSIDYAVIEKSKNLLCIKAHFDWCDCGSFDVIEKLVDEKKIILTEKQKEQIL